MALAITRGAGLPESASTPTLLATSSGSSSYQRCSADTGRVPALSVVAIRTARPRCRRRDPPLRPGVPGPQESS